MKIDKDIQSWAESEIGLGLIKKIIKLLKKNLSGELDGTAFAKTSIKASGRRFVVKGWIDTQKGPAVRFSAPWGDLANGYLLYQPNTDAEWEDVEETEIDLDFDWQLVSLKVAFTREDDSEHKVLFKGVPD